MSYQQPKVGAAISIAGLLGAAAGILIVMVTWANTPADFYRGVIVPDLKQRTEGDVIGLFIFALGVLTVVTGWFYRRDRSFRAAYANGAIAAFVAAILGGIIMAITVFSFSFPW